MIKAAPNPCGSCPYRRDVPSGIWAVSEYDKLPSYDGETFEQVNATNLFMCHQRDGSLCAGWLACHDPQELLACRLHWRELDPSVFTYKTKVPVFGSGAEARRHGLRGIAAPGGRAQKMIVGLLKSSLRK